MRVLLPHSIAVPSRCVSELCIQKHAQTGIRERIPKKIVLGRIFFTQNKFTQQNVRAGGSLLRAPTKLAALSDQIFSGLLQVHINCFRL